VGPVSNEEDQPTADDQSDDLGQQPELEDAATPVSRFDTNELRRAVGEAARVMPRFDTNELRRAVGEAARVMPRQDTTALMLAAAEAARVMPRFDTNELRRAAAQAARVMPRQDTTALMRSAAQAARVMPRYDTTALMRAAMPTLDTASLLRQLSDELVAHLIDTQDPIRRPHIVAFSDLEQLGEAARQLEPDGFNVNDTLGRALRGAAVLIPPTAGDGLLSDDSSVVGRWVSTVMQQVLDASGLSERDLLEDAVAACVYVTTFSLVVALLVQFPLMLSLAGLTGLGSAHGAGCTASKLARQGLQTLDKL
jgi:hypothetical protein